MGDFTAIRTYVYVNGATILANENNTNENTIYTQHNAAFNGLTGHTHTGAVGDGPTLGPSSLNLAGNYNWIGLHTFSQVVELNGGLRVPLGSAANPSIAYVGDLNTGLYSPGADQISVTTNGTQGFLFTNGYNFSNWPFYIADGSVGAPSLAFNSDTNSGLYSVGADSIGLSLGGTASFIFATGASISRAPFHAPDGAVGSPSYSFENDTDTGLYRVGANSFAVTTNGTQGFLFTNGYNFSNWPFYIADGSVGAPSLAFNSDTDLGIYRLAANEIAIAAGGANIATFAAATSTIAGVQIETHTHDLGTNKVNFVDGATTLTQNGVGTNTSTITVNVGGFAAGDTADTSPGAICRIYRDGTANPEWDGTNIFEITAVAPVFAAGTWTFEWDLEVTNGDGSEYRINFNGFGMLIAEETGAPV